MTATSILPTYQNQRYLNGAPIPSSARRSFRPREKYLMLLVFFTFGVVCFGAFFFLPEFKSVGVNPVYNVYKRMQKAGPELLIPVPPRADDFNEKVGLFRHDSLDRLDPHRLEDRKKLKAKIEEDKELEKKMPKVLERPDVSVNRIVNPSTDSVTVTNKVSSDGVFEPGEDMMEVIVTVPPVFSEHYPVISKGEEKDLVNRERRNKVVEVNSVAVITLFKFITSAGHYS